MICPQHSDMDLASKQTETVLDITARQIIAQIKLQEQEKVQESILNTISDSVVSENIERQNLPIVEKEQDDYINLQANLILYKELINEMRDKIIYFKNC